MTAKVHFVGIGGIGVSAIARMFLGEGKVVSGSDRDRSPVTAELEKLGAKIFYQHAVANVAPETDLVIYTIAVPDDNPELARARELGIKTMSYPEILGEISRDKFTIAVAGTHGKTTTTAMLAKIFVDAGLDPTVIVGSLLKGSASNFIAGKSEYFIVEACEYRRSFLNLSPRILVITNIDNDHLDYYRDLADIQSAFAELAAKLPADGVLVCDKNDPRLIPVVKDIRCPLVDYLQFSTRHLSLLIPGDHNVKNAQVAIAVAQTVGVSPDVAVGALNKFKGTWRRFEYKGKLKTGAALYDDYAHHPTEIKATLAAARSLNPRRLIVVFQPHLYSRTKLLFDEFVGSFALADEVVVAPIYAAREPVDPTISSSALVEGLRRKVGAPTEASGLTVIYLSDNRQIVRHLMSHTGPNDLVILMGAGDIFNLADYLV